MSVDWSVDSLLERGGKGKSRNFGSGELTKKGQNKRPGFVLTVKIKVKHVLKNNNVYIAYEYWQIKSGGTKTPGFSKY